MMQLAHEVKAFTCIRCPLGCRVEVTLADDGSVVETSGSTCARGAEYAAQEAAAPERMVTAVVCVAGSLEPVSVKTARPIPKPRIPDVLAAIHALDLRTPIHAGDVLVENACQTGVPIIATKTVE